MSQFQRFYHNPLGRVVYIITGSLLLVFVLAACGSQATTGGQSTSTPPPQTVNCGNVSSSLANHSPSDKAAAQKAEDCLYQAYQQCRPATLTFTTFGVDAGAINHFSVKSVNGSCTISDGVQHYVAPNPPGATSLYTCATMTRQSDGLHIQTCGELGTVLIPAA
ncbi:MAG TPA: hypothetical protein VNE38_03400 [Ktedonobacteraceae bacterium]|nr:hypothetical protein [Ktedonobacteraceae bacterium]